MHNSSSMIWAPPGAHSSWMRQEFLFREATSPKCLTLKSSSLWPWGWAQTPCAELSFWLPESETSVSMLPRAIDHKCGLERRLTRLTGWGPRLQAQGQGKTVKLNVVVCCWPIYRTLWLRKLYMFTCIIPKKVHSLIISEVRSLCCLLYCWFLVLLQHLMFGKNHVTPLH